MWASGPRPGARGPGPSPGPEAREVTRSALHREETGDGPGPMGPGRLIIKVAPWTRTPGFRFTVGECTEQHYSTPLKNATPGNHQMLGRKIVEWRSPYRWGCCPMRHVTRDPLGEVPRPSGPHEKDRPRPVWFCYCPPISSIFLRCCLIMSSTQPGQTSPSASTPRSDPEKALCRGSDSPCRPPNFDTTTPTKRGSLALGAYTPVQKGRTTSS